MITAALPRPGPGTTEDNSPANRCKVIEKIGTPPYHGNPKIMKHFIRASREPNGIR
jgi:hypothetical protein